MRFHRTPLSTLLALATLLITACRPDATPSPDAFAADPWTLSEREARIGSVDDPDYIFNPITHMALGPDGLLYTTRAGRGHGTPMDRGRSSRRLAGWKGRGSGGVPVSLRASPPADEGRVAPYGESIVRSLRTDNTNSTTTTTTAATAVRPSAVCSESANRRSSTPCMTAIAWLRMLKKRTP